MQTRRLLFLVCLCLLIASGFGWLGFRSVAGNLPALTAQLQPVTELVLGETTFESATIAPPASQAAVLVTRVIDGDTFELSSAEKVRYIGINTPETKHPTKKVECFGEQAYQRNRELIEGKYVVLEQDVSQTDRYGRLLRYVWLDGRLLNVQLVTEGYAYASSVPPDIKYQEEILAGQQQAEQRNRGLWAACN